MNGLPPSSRNDPDNLHRLQHEYGNLAASNDLCPQRTPIECSEVKKSLPLQPGTRPTVVVER